MCNLKIELGKIKNRSKEMKIMAEEIERAYNLYSTVCQRPDAISEIEEPYQPLYCLFLNIDGIPKSCQRNCAFVAWARESWELNSPAFFGEFAAIANAGPILNNYCLFKSAEVFQEELDKAQGKVSELEVFVRTSIMGIYPLFLANDSEFPFISQEEIREERNIFLDRGIKPIIEEIDGLSPEWGQRLSSKVGALSFDYMNGVYFLLQLFLRGVRGNREKLFENINEVLRRGHS